LRDGEQPPGVSLSPDEKLQIAKQLANLGVDVIEAGFPIASEGDFEAVRLIAKEVRGGPIICALARAVDEDIDRAWQALEQAERPRIHTFIATSDIHLKHKLEMSREEALERAVRAVERAKRYCDDVEFSAEDASRSDPDYLCQVFAEVIKAGATVLNIPDTVGYALPEEFYNLVRTVIERVPGIERVVVSVHCHNDLGLAVANSLAAIRAGARQVECTINGIGERAGNAALEEVVMALHARRDQFGLETGINTREIYRTSKLVESLTGMHVQPNKAIVGKNAFAHSSGIHQHGVLKERLTYEIIDPEEVGRGESEILLDKHSGRHAVKRRLEELGYKLTDEQLGRVFARFKHLADKKKFVLDRDLEAIVADEIRTAPETYSLEYAHVVSGYNAIPFACVRLRKEGKLLEPATGTGNGPVDALYKTIAKVVDIPHRLTDFSIRALTGGSEAMGEVMVEIESGGEVFRGIGISTDIIEASAKAYLQAINKLVQRLREKGKA